MKAIRWALAKVILTLDWFFAPRAKLRSESERARIQKAASGLFLYQFAGCPFCVKVRRFLKAEGVELPLCDATRQPSRQELVVGGGRLQVPCLKIVRSEAPVEWLYESGDIISYLKRELAL